MVLLLNLHLESPSCLLLFWLLDAVIHQMRIYVHDLFLYRLIIVALVVVVVCAHPCGTAKWDVPAGQIILGHKRGGGGQQMGGEKGLGVIEVTFSSASLVSCHISFNPSRP
jgi:cytosine/uracil/thiamine/allantoin permease